jgi:hypothetical protein
VSKKQISPEGLELEERIVQINRVSKVVKGGRRFSFSTMVVVGDGNGHVGIGMGKAAEVPDAIRKGVDAAKKNLIYVPLSRTTIVHEMEAEFSATKVRLIPVKALWEQQPSERGESNVCCAQRDEVSRSDSQGSRFDSARIAPAPHCAEC